MAQCVFCGGEAKTSREHVWAKWLRNYPAFGLLADGYKGERQSREDWMMRLDEEGRYRSYPTQGRQEATLLPFLTVPVCQPCNGGWMSQLETQAQGILDPLIRGDATPTEATVAQQEALATWLAKCALGYVVGFQESDVPFRVDEYRALARGEPAPSRCVIWMGRSLSLYAYIGMFVHPLLLASVATDPRVLGWAPATSANVFLAAHSVVFVAHWLPEEMMPLYESFVSFEQSGFSRIWPPTPGLAWPTTPVDDETFVAVRDFLHSQVLSAALPMEGREPQELENMAEDYLSGAHPIALRRRWARRDRVRRFRGRFRGFSGG